ncbi:MAG TPA: amino acid ABC transporter substrate-binding protein [Xanthobacteraceae bacterium]|nr:amino acid ABC transporter substrate-binding protein [Xanthobacteraceae bacterium]
MRRREFLKYTAATAVAAPFVRAAGADTSSYKVGVIGAKTGPLAPGAAVTHFPPYRLWANEVNARGGLKLKDGQRKIELFEYDDRTQPPEAIKAVERAATVDKVDWIGGNYATGFNLACAPTFAKHGYPQLTQACVTDQGPALVKKYPGFFMFQSSTTAYAKGAIGVLKKLKDAGQIGNKVAAVNVADDFGIELANAGRPLFKEAGFEIVYDKSYPLGTQDYTPVIKAAKAANPDAFVAWSYPPDTFGLADVAKIEGLNVKAYYCAVGCAFQGFSQKNGAAAENVLGAGGVVDSPEIRDFYKRHKEVTQVDADYWGSPFYYSMLQMLTQSIETVGTTDREKIADHFRNRKFKVLVGEVELPGQILDKVYTVGQWQGGFFSAVNGEGFGNYAAVKLKTSWG